MATEQNQASARWRDAIPYYAYRGIEETANGLPDGLVPLAISLGARALQVGSPARREQVGRNLTRIFDGNISEPDRSAMVDSTFRNYARYWYELFKGTSQQSIEELSYDEAELGTLHKVIDEKQGAIICLPHMGNWDLFAAWGARHDVPLTVVAEPAPSQRVTDWFVQRREAAGLDMVLLGDPQMRQKLTSAIKVGRAVALFGDRDITGKGTEVDFFGENTQVPVGPAMLALRTGAPIVPVASYFEPGNQHSAVISEPIYPERNGSMREDLGVLAQKITNQLESSIRRAPDQWFVMQPNWPSDQPEAATR